MPNWKKLVTSGSDASLNSLNVAHLTASGLNYPSSDGSANQVLSTDGSGNLSFVAVGAANLPDGVISSSTQIVSGLSNQDVDFGTGDITANSFTGDGSGLTGISATVPAGTVSSSAFSSPSQGTVRATINGVQTDVDTGLQTGDSPQFTNLTLTGNLTVDGTTTSINSTEVNIGDNIIVLNSGETGTPSQDAGIEIERGTSTNVKFQFKESTDRWQFSNDGSVFFNLPTSTADIAEFSNLYYTDARVKTKLNAEGVISGSSQIDHDQTTNFVANEHIDHSSITIGSGRGLSGGGTIDTSRSLSLDTGSTHFIDGTVSALSNQDVDFGTGDVTATTGSFDILGVGTASPSYALEVQGDSTTGVLAIQNASNGRDTLRSMNAAGVRTSNLGNDASGHGLIIGRNSSGVIKNYIAGDGDSYFTAGNVLVGKTSTGMATAGHEFNAGDYAYHTRDGGIPLYLNRLTDDGEILEFRKDTSIVGAIGTYGGTLFVSNGDTGLQYNASADQIRPCGATGAARDNAIDLGDTTRRFKDLYLGGTGYIDGNLTVGGTVTAQEFHTEFVSASIIYTSGSTKFGDTSDDVHSFSGSLRVSGSGNHFFTDGNVGIGESSPSYVLDVNTTSDRARFKATSGDADIELSSIAGHDYLIQSKNDSSFVIYDEDEASSRLVINSSGNVGIGTSSPGTILDVQRSDSSTVMSRLWNTNSSGDGASVFRIANSGNNNNGNRIEFSDANYYMATISADRTQGILFRTSATGTNPITIPERMRISPSGNVGIGTSSPQAELHVEGDISGSGTLYVNTVRDVTNDIIVLRDNSTNVVRLGSGDGSDKVHIFAGGGSDPRLMIDTSGRVGIGVTDPAVELEVGGSTNTQVLISTTNNTGNSQLYFGDSDSDSSGIILYRHANDSMAFEVGGAERMRISGSGNVGIGTTSPTKTLTVNGDIGFSAGGKKIITDLSSGGTTRTAEIEFYNSSDGSMRFSTNNSSTGGINFYTQGSERLRISKDGNVGIGTTSPGSALDVAGILTINTRDIASNPRLVFNHDNILGTSFIEVDRGTEDMEFYVSGSERMRIMDNGNVGIGTSSPATKLEIFGTGNTLRLDSAANQSKEILLRNVGSGTATIKTDGDLKLFAEDANKSIIFENNGGEAMRIDSSGNVGIGTTSPDSKLHVSSGDIRITNNSPSIYFYDSDVSGLYHRILGGGNKGLEYSVDPNNTTAGYHRWDIGGTVVAQLIEGGNFGLGTTSPSNLLHLSSSAAAIRISSIAGGANIYLDNASGNNSRVRYNSSTGYFALRDDNASSDVFVISGSNGNVGIGTTSPSRALHVNSGTTNEVARFESTDTEVTLEFKDTTGTSKIKSRADFRFETGATPTEAMRIDSSGNVGIGTTSPDTNLHVYKASAGSVSAHSDAVLAVENSGVTAINLLSGATSHGQIMFGDANDADAGQLGYDHTTNLMYIKTNGSSTKHFNVDSSGNVGIGTDSPLSKLTVAVNAIDGGATDSIRLIDADDDTTVDTENRIRFGKWINSDGSSVSDVASINAGISQWGATSGLRHGYLSFYTVEDGQNTEKMRIDSSGNVMVGKTATGLGNEGAELSATGQLKGTAKNQVVAYLNRSGSDGTIAEFRKDNTAVGVIGNNGSDLYIASENAGLRFRGGLTQDRIVPVDDSGAGLDNSVDLGDAGTRFENLFLGGTAKIDGAVSASAFSGSFVGDGSGLTGISGGGSGAVSSVANGANNRIATFSGTDTLNGEANLTFDGGILAVNSTDLYVSGSRVGIGTDSPNHKLEVFGGSGAGTYNLFRGYAWNGSANKRVEINLDNTESDPIAIWNTSRSGGSVVEHSFQVDSSEKMRIDSSGNVGIGTTSPTKLLEVSSTSNPTISIANEDTSLVADQTIGTLDFAANNETSLSSVYTSFASISSIAENDVTGTAGVDGALIFSTSLNNTQSEKMRIDSSGNVLIGDTTGTLYDSTSETGINLNNSGAIYLAYTSADFPNFNRVGSDGELIRLRKDGSRVGSIGTGGGSLDIYSSGTNSVGLRFAQAVIPMLNGSVNDGDVDLGTSTRHFKDLYLAGTATVGSLVETSTRKLKKDITELEDQSSVIDSLQPVSYTWKETEKEDFGLVAEDVADIAPQLVERDDEGNPTGIKYSKLSVLLLDVVQRQSTLIEDLNERITKLENERT